MKIIRRYRRLQAIAMICLGIMAFACNQSKQSKITMSTSTFNAGTFGYDQLFLAKNHKPLILSDSIGQSKIMIMPEWQARVMTSSASGDSGFSFGWINYKQISSGKPAEHINAFGGEERFWLGPEGGPFSLYFKPGVSQEFANWYVPAVLDTLPFEISSQTQSQASFLKKCELTNYTGTKLTMQINRDIRLIPANEIYSQFGLPQDLKVKCVGYETENSITNQGKEAWNKQTGGVSIWMLSMLTPSPGVMVFLPYKTDSKQKTIVNDDYFGKVPADRLGVKDGIIWFKADGKHRSKIGLPPGRATNVCGSYDAQNKVLTILWCELPEKEAEYVNSKWGKQDNPFAGDVLNAYNDGQVEDGSQMGPFYELESSSPAAFLKPGEKITHRQRIFHFEGEEEELGKITQNIIGTNVIKTKPLN